MAEQTYAQPMLNLQPREATETTWASITQTLGLTWERWPDSWSSGRDFSAAWTATIRFPDRSYVYIDVHLWRRLLSIKWQVDGRRMDYTGEGRSGRPMHRLAARAYLEDPSPTEALAAAVKLGLVGAS